MKIRWPEIINNILEMKILYCGMKYAIAGKMFGPICNQTLMKKFYWWQLGPKFCSWNIMFLKMLQRRPRECKRLREKTNWKPIFFFITKGMGMRGYKNMRHQRNISEKTLKEIRILEYN